MCFQPFLRETLCLGSSPLLNWIWSICLEQRGIIISPVKCKSGTRWLPCRRSYLSCPGESACWPGGGPISPQVEYSQSERGNALLRCKSLSDVWPHLTHHRKWLFIPLLHSRNPALSSSPKSSPSSLWKPSQIPLVVLTVFTTWESLCGWFRVCASKFFHLSSFITMSHLPSESLLAQNLPGSWLQV